MWLCFEYYYVSETFYTSNLLNDNFLLSIRIGFGESVIILPDVCEPVCSGACNCY